MRVLKRTDAFVGLACLAVLVSGALATSGQGRPADANRIEARSGGVRLAAAAVYLGCQPDPASGSNVCVDAQLKLRSGAPRLSLDDGGAIRLRFRRPVSSLVVQLRDRRDVVIGRPRVIQVNEKEAIALLAARVSRRVRAVGVNATEADGRVGSWLLGARLHRCAQTRS